MSDATTQTGKILSEEDQLQRQLHGEVIGSGDSGYEDARAVWNGMIDRHPRLIARCADVADVITSVRFARKNGLVLAVRGGGHNVSGSAVCDGGLVIDLSGMSEVEVDQSTRIVRAQAGVTIGELDRATHPFGLAVPQGLVSKTGIAGLTLGGGLGWLRRKHGLSCDNVISVELVTADGEVVRASEHENQDLFWAVRGGGGNFGVVTSFEFRAHPVGPDVFFGLVFHPWPNAAAALRFYRGWQESTPDAVSSFGVLWTAPPIDEIAAEHHHRPVVVFAAMYAGDVAEGERTMGQLREFGEPLADLSAVTRYTELQTFFDEDYPDHIMRYYWKSLYLSGLTDEGISQLVALHEQSPSPHSTLDIWQLGGAMARVRPEQTAFGDRSAPFLLGIEANWEDPADDAANLAWARRVFDTMRPFSTGSEYLNFPGFHEDGERAVRAAFGANYARLEAVKQAYDPSNLFRLNSNIQPASDA